MNDEKITKWPYLGRFDSKWKNKGTLFSSTLKVEGNKVLLFFHFGLKSPRYEHFLVFTNHYHWWLRRGPRWWKWWFWFFSSSSSHCQLQNLSARNKNGLILLHKRSVSLSWKWPILAILQCKMAKIWVGGTGRFPGSNLIFFFIFDIP